MNIRDIASAPHVSVATVSKVINHKDSEISNETRQRVLSVIKEYQYTPYANIQASFQTFHRQTIAFLTEKNSAVSKYVFDIEKNVSKAGYSLIVCTVDTPQAHEASGCQKSRWNPSGSVRFQAHRGSRSPELFPYSHDFGFFFYFQCVQYLSAGL